MNVEAEVAVEYNLSYLEDTYPASYFRQSLSPVTIFKQHGSGISAMVNGGTCSCLHSTGVCKYCKDRGDCECSDIFTYVYLQQHDVYPITYLRYSTHKTTIHI